MTKQANVLTQIEMLTNTDFEFLYELSDTELDKLFDATKHLTQTVILEQKFRKKISAAIHRNAKKWIAERRDRHIRLELKKIDSQSKPHNQGGING